MAMGRVYESALELIGNTPLLKLSNRIVPEDAADVYVKLECFNIGGSVKDRPALNMIEEAERQGLITPGKTVLADCTSGNTGIGEALVAARKGYKIVIVMNEMASIERRKLLKAYGAEVVLVSKDAGGIKGDFEVFNKLVEENGYFALRQFENQANPAAHKKTTGPEIVEQLGGVPDLFVATAGTGGTFSGTSEYLKEVDPKVRTVAVEPAGSPVLNGGQPGKHKIAGIGPGIIPETLHRDVIDEVFDVTDEQAIETARKLAVLEGILVGYSSGAAVYAAIEEAKKAGKGKKVVTIAPDGGDRYLSTELFEG
jgi:cysteine synthase A